MTTLEKLIEGYQQRTEELHQEDFNRRMSYGKDIRQHIYVRAVDRLQRIPFTVCPGEKRVRIDIDNLCTDYMVCSRVTNMPLEGWSITLT